MGDPSSFINLMLRYPGNRNFARGVVSYLVEDDTWGRRGGNLYVLSGSFRQIGSYGEAEGWREALLERQSALLDWLEELRTHGLPEPTFTVSTRLLVWCVRPLIGASRPRNS